MFKNMTLDELKTSYTPIPNFYDLRKFDLNLKEFKAVYKIQITLNRYKQFQERDINFKINNRHSWEQAKQLSAELQMFLLSRLKVGEDI